MMRFQKAKLSMLTFLFAPASPLPLAFLRISVATILLVQAMFLAPHLGELYGSSSLLTGISNNLSTPWLNVPAWITLMSRLGISESLALTGLSVIYLFSLTTLLLGWKTHLAAFLVFLTHMIFMNDQPTAYGTDFFAHVALFFLIWVPSGATLSLDSLFKPGRATPSGEARLGLRVFQIYLCIAYLASGLEKMLGEQWLNGEAIWRSLMLPSLGQFSMDWLSQFPVLAKLAGWGTLVVETLYPVFIWPKKTRGLWVILTVMLHVGIAVFLGLWLFSALMIVLNLGAFGLTLRSPRLRYPQASKAREPLPFFG